jgi:hypothetical protein
MFRGNSDHALSTEHRHFDRATVFRERLKRDHTTDGKQHDGHRAAGVLPHLPAFEVALIAFKAVTFDCDGDFTAD